VRRETVEEQRAAVVGYVSSLMRIESAFGKAGIRLLNKDVEGGIGVRLAR
jgi:hypothetical protein